VESISNSELTHETRQATLASLLRDEPASLEEVLPIFVRVIERMSSIHSNAAIRPVMDPRTIRWGENGEVTIDSIAVLPNQNTRALLGKYASFEELSESADGHHLPESDIYVAGFIFFEILLGRTLFDSHFSEFTRGDVDYKWLNWHCDPTKTAPALEKFLPEFPVVLSQTIETMMAKEAAARPVSAVIVAAFEGVLQRLSLDRIAQVPTVRVRRKRSWAPAKRLLKRAAFAVLVIMITGGVLGGAGWLVWRGYNASPTVAGEQPSTTGEGSSVETALTPEGNPDSGNLPAEIDSGTGTMVLVPATEFAMGSDQGLFNGDVGYESESPSHTVRVEAFYIDKYEVTNRFYKEFCDATGRPYPPNPEWDDRYFDKPDYPVMNVSWNDARAYAVWAGKALPTEAQWELAARGPAGNRYPWGNEFRENAANLTGSGDGARFTAEVGAFRLDTSPFGIMDMAGNVSEWVNDLYALYPGNSGQLAASERSHRVVRGAGITLGRDHARLTRRMSHRPEIDASQHTAIGFRCVTEAQTVIDAIQSGR
jgi:formylglycine-generating enzyme required for sulfatase activity